MKTLFLLALAAAGLGFAGYVYLIPYTKMEHAAMSRQDQAAAAQSAAESAEAERDKLKADLAKFIGNDQEKADSEAKRKAAADTLGAGLRVGLEGLGATVTVNGAALSVSFPAAKVIDKNGIDVSTDGLAALKILAGAAQKQDATVRIRARTSSAQPPKELRGLFHSIGELRTVRAARVMTALEAAGLSPAHLQIVGEPDKPAPRAGRSKKPPPPPADHLDLEVEPA